MMDFTDETKKTLAQEGITYKFEQGGTVIHFNKAHNIPLSWKITLEKKYKLTEEEFIKEHPSLKGKIIPVEELIKQDITNVIGATSDGYKDDTKWWKPEDFHKLGFVLKEAIHKTQLDKQKILKALKDAKEKCPLKGLNLSILDWYEQYIINNLRLK